MWKYVCTLAFLMLGVSVALTQEAVLTVPFPEVVVYEPQTGALYNVTAEGTKSGANMSDVAAFDKQMGYNYKLSPDRTKLLFIMNETAADGLSTSAVYIADVASGACCQKLDPQDPNMNTVLSGLFNADGTLFAAAYYSNQYEKLIPGQMVVFEVATGAIVARLDSSRLDNSHFNNVPAPGITYSEWTPSGLVVHPTCVGCEPPLDGLAQLWNPSDNSVTEPKVSFNMLDRTLATGESMRAVLDTSFPNNPDAIGMLPVPNVVTYAPRQVGSSETPPVVYFNPNNIYIYQTEWVADGLGILIIHADQAEWFMPSTEVSVLLRDGTRVPLTIPVTRSFLATTSDGWVMTDQQTMGYVYYRLTGTTVEEIVLDATYSGYAVVVNSPKFGASALNAPIFPTVTAP